MISILLGTAILVIYLTYCIIKTKEVPPSISDTFYTSGRWVFTFVMVAESILLMVGLLPITPQRFQWIAFLASVPLAFVGSAPHFKEDFEKSVHYVGAFMFGIFSQIWCATVVTPKLLAVWFVAVFFGVMFPNKSTLIAELACVTSLVTGALILYL